METIAKYISDGTNTANILNALKWDMETKTLSLYSTNNEELKSSCELPIYDNKDAVEVEKPVRGMYNVGYLISDALKSTDCTTEIQKYIDLCAEDGGGVIRFGSGIYRYSTLTIPSGVSLIGSGIGNTILARVPSSHSEGEIESIYSSRGSIYIPASSRGITISNMSIFGGVELGLTKDEDYQVSGRTTYNDNRIATGIYIANGPVAETNEGLAVLPYSVHMGQPLSYDTPFKNIVLENLAIIGFSGSGIFVGANCSNVTINNVITNINRYAGIITAGSHIQVSNLVANGNGDNGILNIGPYNKFVNIECNYNGKYNHLNAAGFYSETSDLVVNNIEAKFSYSRGIVVDADRCQFTNVICDANGARDDYDESSNEEANNNPRDVPQVVLSGAHIVFKGSICNYRAGETIKVADKPMLAEGLNKSIVELLVLKDSAENNSMINDTEMIDSVYNNTSIIPDGLLTYILQQ